jgi:7-carboxy-7-deazaguanine synthase
MRDSSLRITEIFYSLQGEARTSGLPTVFVRLTGCPLRCNYCDSEYAFFGGERMELAEILDKVASYKPRHVCVTGGEPLAQPNCLPLLETLCDQGYEVSLETSGAMSIESVDTRVSRVVDLKTPDSDECSRNLYENIAFLTPNDQVKFVICSRKDYEWARLKLDECSLTDKVGDILFSPCAGRVNPTDLADWIVEDNLPVRFQVQLHKILWADEPGR